MLLNKPLLLGNRKFSSIYITLYCFTLSEFFQHDMISINEIQSGKVTLH